jgi:DNA repair exonuclease SbcCD ATPase subunit
MKPEIKALSDELHELYEQIMQANPWDEGYGEVVAIHEYLMRVLRDKANEDYAEFQQHLTTAAQEIEKTWSTNKPQLQKWKKQLEPVFETVEKIITKVVPLLALLA